MSISNIKITEASKALFVAYANDSGNWSGQPLVGGNVGGTKEDRGNLTQLKRQKLIRTYRQDGHDWLVFLPLGKEFALSLGIKIAE